MTDAMPTGGKGAPPKTGGSQRKKLEEESDAHPLEVRSRRKRGKKTQKNASSLSLN